MRSAVDKIKQKENAGLFAGMGGILKSRSFRIVLALLIVLAAVGLIVLIGVLLPMQMFSKNPRFTLTRVKVIAHPRGFWKDKEPRICRIMNVKPGTDNLFQFRLQNLAARLKNRPSIERVSVSRVLPDTLCVRIVEREPRALINSPDSVYVVDGNCTLMMRTECMNITSSLPVISGVRSLETLHPGLKIRNAEHAMEFIRFTQTQWPDIRVTRIILRKKSMLCAVYYKSFPHPFRVELPKKEIPRKVRELATALERIVMTGSPMRSISLLYENQAVLSGLPKR